MHKSHAKSALELVKDSSMSAVSRSNTAAKGMMDTLFPNVKDELKDRIHDKTKVTPRPHAKENTKPQEFKLHTEQRALKRAMFNYSVATKLYLMELQKKQVEKLEKMIEEEEIRMLRKEMIPRAQLMPFFDRPFFPQRSNRPLTIPREPSFMLNNQCGGCISENEFYYFNHAHSWKPVE
ncbi:hypothetical protein K2173_023313 [Erythroxylum novogranatense]|uniref:TPX2 C-terminal domain-containing protein n=1 Tax=Erythroxylum novogranatense TaxID=1862640 RepID=A0AAV8T902_9ROSI|nr:hypothetical protein K2173_023313 [Erythroxylum novogranatense]